MNKESAIHHVRTFSAKQKKIALTIVALAFVMDLLDSTIVNIAIPSIQSNLHASFATIQWLVAGYSLTFALLLITGGRMGDVFGYKKMFMVGVGGFTVASLLAGVAPNAGFLVFARLLQGAMAAIMAPQVMSVMQVMYAPKERAGVMGLFGMLGGLGASLGPVIGGLLIKFNLFGWDWRPIFLLNLPVGIFALIAGMKYLPEGKSIHPLHIDIKGTLLIVVALGLMVFPLIEGRDLNWPIWALVMLGLSIPAIMLFGWYEIRKDKRDKSALIVPALFKLKSFISGLGLNVIVESIMIGYFLTVTLVMQIGMGYSPIKAALTGVPTAVGMGIGFAVLGNRFIAKFGRMAINVGVLFFAAGLILTTWIITHFNIQAHPWQFIPGLFFIGIGLSQIMVPIFSAALQDVDPNHAGSASGILNAVQQVGGAIGVAIIGVIFFGNLTHDAYASFDSVKPDLEKQLTAQAVPADIQNEIISQSRACYHDRTTEKDTSAVPASCQAAEQSVPEGIAFREKLTDIVTAASLKANAINFASAFRTGAIYVLLLLILVCGLSFLLPKKLKVNEEAAAV